MRKITRGSIFYADLDPIVGSEQKGFRPVLILQNDVGNKFSPTTMIAPITNRDNIERNQPTHVLVKEFSKIRPNSIILLEQIRTIDKSRLRGYVCDLSDEGMEKVEKAIKVALGIK